MSEIRNPNFETPDSDRGGKIGPVLIFFALSLVLLFGYGYFQASEIKLPVNWAHNAHLSRPPVVSETVEFGWLSFLAKPLYLALSFLHKHGVHNWGWAIIAFTALFNSVMFWPRIIAMKSSLRMMRLQPSVDALKKRYEHLRINDPKRVEMHAKMTALYKSQGVSMYGGCLPLLFQMPLLFAYFRVLQNAVELHGAQWFWIADLSAPDPLHVVALIILVSMFVTQWITPAPGIDRTQKRMMAVAMPVVMGFTLWHSAAGLALYWATGNLMNLMFQIVINHTKMGREMRGMALRRGLVAANGGGVSRCGYLRGRARKKSKANGKDGLRRRCTGYLPKSLPRKPLLAAGVSVLLDLLGLDFT